MTPAFPFILQPWQRPDDFAATVAVVCFIQGWSRTIFGFPALLLHGWLHCFAGWCHKHTHFGCLGSWWRASLRAVGMSRLFVACRFASWPSAIRQPYASCIRCILALLAGALRLCLAAEHCRCFREGLWPVPKPLQGLCGGSGCGCLQPNGHCRFAGPRRTGTASTSHGSLASKLCFAREGSGNPSGAILGCGTGGCLSARSTWTPSTMIYVQKDIIRYNSKINLQILQ